MSGHADTIRRAITSIDYCSQDEFDAAYEALDALVAENQQQAETIKELQAIVDDLFERNGWAKIGWERPPEHVFAHFRKLHGIEATS